MVRGRGKDRREPDTLNAKVVAVIKVSVVEIIHTVDNTVKISDTVTVSVREGAYEYLVEGSVIIVGGVGERRDLFGCRGLVYIRRTILVIVPLAGNEGKGGKNCKYCENKA